MIKVSINQKMKIYDDAYEIADYLIKLYNPCKITKPRKYHVYTRKYKIVARCRKRSDFTCCGVNSCIYLTIKGCRIKSLGCKLFLCSAIRSDLKFRKLVETLDLIKNSVEKYLLLDKPKYSWQLKLEPYLSRNKIIKQLKYMLEK